MRNSPKISIVIPSYNKAKYIGETLDSILSQKYPNVEIIIQDGGSTDGSVEIIKSYAKKHPKHVIWISKKDKGQMDAINKGLKKAKGDIFTYINADDVYKSNSFMVVSRLHRKHPNSLWFVGQGDVIDAHRNEISPWVTKYKNLLLKINNYQLLLAVNYLMQPSVFISKKAYEQHGPFTGNKKFVLEYDLWLKLGKIKMPTVTNEFLSSFRMSGDNISSVQYNDTLSEDYRIVNKYTKSELLLLLHRWHNRARVYIGSRLNQH